MKQIFLFLLFIISSNIAKSQPTKEYEFVGTLQLNNQSLISFQLIFSETSPGKIDGYTVTDIYGEHRTKSKISGTFNQVTGIISFRETANVSSRSTARTDEFCFVQVNKARIKEMNGKALLQGRFTGVFSNGQKCADGSFYLISARYLEQMAEKFLQGGYIKNKDTLSRVKQQVEQLKERKDKTVLKGDETLQVVWSSNEIILDVWDGQYEDQDEISIYVDGKKILDQFVIRQQKKTLVIPFTGKVSKVEIFGLNEGLSAPCTANLFLRDGDTIISMMTELKKGEHATIRLTKAP